MKKSQILAALALAFALGVVAPVSSASAYVMAGEGRQEVIDGITAALKKADALGDCTEGSKNLLSNYWYLISTIGTQNSNIATAKKNAYETLRDYMNDTTLISVTLADSTTVTKFSKVMEAAGVAADNNTWKTYNSTVVNAYTNYDALVTYADGLADALQTVFEADNSLTDVKTAADLIRNNTATGGYVGEAKKTVSDAEAGAATAVTTILGNAPFSLVTTGITTYDQAVAAAKGLPKYSNFEVIISEYVDLTNIKDSPTEGYRVVTAQKALDQFNADIVGFCSTNLGTVETPTPDTNEPEAPATKPGAGAPNSGVVAGADATAKATVSIMAAIASVATAAFVAIRKIAAGKKA